MEIFVEQPNEPVGKNFSPAHKSNRDNMAESGLAAKTWHKEMPEVAKLFSQFKVYDFMQDMYEEFHVQGDNTTFDAFKDTTFSWKLVYKDLHGIGDTLDHDNDNGS